MSIETDILSEVEALKAKFSETRSLYREVCALLFFRFGITPTANKLYQYVRRGSMNVPTEEVGKFWDDLRHRARVDIQHPDLPDSIKSVAAEAIAALWSQATESARNELAAVRLQFQQEAEQARVGRDAAEQAVARMSAAAEHLRSEIERVQAESQSTREELETERRAHAATQARAQQMQTQLEEVGRQQKALRDAFAAELASSREVVDAANERANGAERRALREIEQERQARARADSAAEAARQRLAEVESASREQAIQHAAQATRLEIDGTQAKLALESAVKAQQSLTRQVSELEQNLAEARREASRRETEAQTLKALVERLTPSKPNGGATLISTGRRRTGSGAPPQK